MINITGLKKMKSYISLIVIFIIFLFALEIFIPQEKGFAQESIEPEEPEIVLPSVVLELEDLSVEVVIAELPGDEELLPPEISFSLPETEDIIVEEPQVDYSILGPGKEGYVKGEKGYTVEGVLGTGTLNQFYSSIAVYHLEALPEVKVRFLHEIMDGFSGKSPGEGYNLRDDQLESSVRFKTREVDITVEGSFSDKERGLQGMGSYYSRINREVYGSGEAEYDFSENFNVKGSIMTSAASHLLTGKTVSIQGVEERVTEFIVNPSVTVEYRFGRGKFSFVPGYTYRSVPDISSLSAHMAGVKGYFEYDFSEAYQMQLNAGWQWSEITGHRLPFDISVNVIVSEFFSFNVGAGYNVETYNLRNILSEYPLMGLPALLEDNHGLFFRGRTTWTPRGGVIIDAGLSLTQNQNLPVPVQTQDVNTGLFPFSQQELIMLNTDIGIRWHITKMLSARVGLTSELMERPLFYPANQLTMELRGVEKVGRYGGDASMRFITGVNDFVQAPVVSLRGYYQATDFFTISAEVDDLLFYFLDGPRYTWYPYLDTGFNITLKAYLYF